MMQTLLIKLKVENIKKFSLISTNPEAKDATRSLLKPASKTFPCFAVEGPKLIQTPLGERVEPKKPSRERRTKNLS